MNASSTHDDAAGSLDLLAAYLQAEVQPMILLDTHYNILSSNLAYQRQFGVEGKRHVGRKCFNVSHGYDVPCDRAGEHCPMQRATETGAPDRVLHIHHTPRGPEHVDVELRPVKDSGGKVIAFVERLATVRSASARARAQGLVGRADTFMVALTALQRVAPSMLPVLLLGESGTGKELFARAVHEGSERADGPFVVVDCSGLTENLFESELFGHEKGAFTGANARKTGLLETAQGGTLFLDEMGDVPLAMQVKLLRLIESGTYRRVGSVETRRADFRVVSATHKPLMQMVRSGAFRQDLYYRISVFPIHLPALRERMSDLPLLVASILQRAALGKAPLSVSAEAMTMLLAHTWPGNIRELRNVLDRARLLAEGGVIEAGDIRLDKEGPSFGGYAPPLALAQQGHSLDDMPLAQRVKRFRGTRKMLAQELGWSERTLYRKLKALGID